MKIKQDLGRLQIDRLALLIVISWIGQLFCAQRWRLFAFSQGMPDSYSTFFQIYFLGMLFNVGLPSLVGGDTIKAYLISRKAGKALHKGLASVLQDRAVGLISLLIYGSAAVLLGAADLERAPALAPVWVGLGRHRPVPVPHLERGLCIPPISYPPAHAVCSKEAWLCWRVSTIH